MQNLIHFSDTHLSDLYKDVNGFRPRHMAEWWTEADLEAEYARLQSELDIVMVREEEAHKAALVRFEELIQDTIDLGAGNRETALRWLMDAEGTDITNKQDVDHFFWNQGISFAKIDEFSKIVVDTVS